MAFRIEWIQIRPRPGEDPIVVAHYAEPHPREVTGLIGGDFQCTSVTAITRAKALGLAVRAEIEAAYSVVAEPTE